MTSVLNLKINMKVYLGILGTVALGLFFGKYVLGLEDPYLIAAAIILGIIGVPFYRRLAGYHDDDDEKEQG